MPVETHRICISTKGDSQVIDLTSDVVRCLADGSVRDGLVTVFVVGSTAALSTTEYEPGLVNHDLRADADAMGFYWHLGGASSNKSGGARPPGTKFFGQFF